MKMSTGWISPPDSQVPVPALVLVSLSVVEVIILPFCFCFLTSKMELPALLTVIGQCNSTAS